MQKHFSQNLKVFFITALILSGCSQSQFAINEAKLFDTIPANQGQTLPSSGNSTSGISDGSTTNTPASSGSSSGASTTIDWQAWNLAAIRISMKFEGGDFANITGNFDGAGLTCGALGWTMEWGNQQPLVKQFVSAYGLAALQALMPKTADEYWRIIQLTNDTDAINQVNVWSNGTANVAEPYRSELENFWKDSRMVTIQNAQAWKTIGSWAQVTAQKFADTINMPVSFQYFSYFFDQAVLNGTAGVPAVSDADKLPIETVFNWMQSYVQGYCQTDFQKNRVFWEGLVAKKPWDLQILFKMAYLRALQSRVEFKPVTMNRRATLALGTGYVNGVLYN